MLEISSLDHGITNLNGEVSFTATITEDTNFYCLYYGTGDYNPCMSNEINVEYQSYLFYDECNSATGLSNYGEWVKTKGTASNGDFSFQTDCYLVSGTGTEYGGKPILALDGEDNYKLKLDYKIKSSSNYCQLGIIIYDLDNPTTKYVSRIMNTNTMTMMLQTTNIETGTENKTISSSTSAYRTLTVSFNNTNHTLTFETFNNGSSMGVLSKTIPSMSNPRLLIGGYTNNGSSYGSYFKNIIVEAL